MKHLFTTLLLAASALNAGAQENTIGVVFMPNNDGNDKHNVMGINYPDDDDDVVLIPSCQGINYTVTGAKTCAVTNSPDAKGAVTIPATVTISGKKYTVTAIGDRAFQGCEALVSVDIPSSVTTIGVDAFDWCNALEIINVDKNNPKFKSVDGVLFSKNSTTLHHYPKGRTDTDYSIPHGVTTIDNRAFAHCQTLTSIALPSSLTTINTQAFYNCAALSSLQIPQSVTYIGDEAFDKAPTISSIFVDDDTFFDPDAFFDPEEEIYAYDGDSQTLIQSIYYKTTGTASSTVTNSPDAEGNVSICSSIKVAGRSYPVTSIAKRAFNGCKALKSVNIPASVTTIGSEAFRKCSALKTINCHATNPPATPDDPAFPKGVTIHVPRGCADAYRAATYWQDCKIVDDL